MLPKNRFFLFIILASTIFAPQASAMELQLKYQNAQRELNDKAIKEIENIIGYTFKDRNLLKQAFTTRSANPKENYERLEFLGDKILDFVLVELLYTTFEKAQEGALSEAKVALVRQEPLAALCQKLKLQEYIQSKQKNIPISCLCDVIEALIGAIYKDDGPEAAKEFILRFFQPMIKSKECPAKMEKVIINYSKDLKQNITYEWDTNKTCLIKKNPGTGIIHKDRPTKKCDTKSDPVRFNLYCAEYKFIKKLPPPYCNKIICLALDPEYSLLSSNPQENKQKDIPVVQSNANTSKPVEPLAENKKEKASIKQDEMVEIPVSAKAKVVPCIFSWEDKIEKNYRMRLHNLIQKFYGKDTQFENSLYQPEQSDEDDTWTCTLHCDNLEPITVSGMLTKGDAQEEAARIAYGQLQRLIMLKNDQCPINLPDIAAKDQVSELNLFCQEYGLEIPEYKTCFKNKIGKFKNGINPVCSTISAPWLRFEIKGKTSPTVKDAKSSAAERVIRLINHLSNGTDCIEPKKLYKLWRIQEALIPRKNARGCLIDLCRIAKIPEDRVTISSAICEGPVTEGLKFQATMTIPKNQTAKLVIGERVSSKQEAEDNTARKAIALLANKIIKDEINKNKLLN